MTPYLAGWPLRVKPGTSQGEHLISALDPGAGILGLVHAAVEVHGKAVIQAAKIQLRIMRYEITEEK